jgi:hypothetical protein
VRMLDGSCGSSILSVTVAATSTSSVAVIVIGSFRRGTLSWTELEGWAWWTTDL